MGNIALHYLTITKTRSSTYNPSVGSINSVLKGTGSALVNVGRVPVALLGSFMVSRILSPIWCSPLKGEKVVFKKSTFVYKQPDCRLPRS